MTQIYLIRHTQAEGNRYRMMQGHWDGDVTPLGLKEIDALSARFRNIPVDAVYSSDLTRAVLTAEGVARIKGLPVLQDVRLRELDLGPWESQFFGNITYRFPAEADVFLHDPGNWKIDGAETAYDVMDRAYPALLEIAESHDGQTVAVVSHGVTIRCLMTKILGLSFSPEEILPIFKNTAVTKLLFENGSFSVEYMNDASHIEGLSSGDWVMLGALRDEAFCPADDPDFYLACYEDAWRITHGGRTDRFQPALYYEAALKHSEANPDAVCKIFDGETCVGLLDCDTEKGAHANYGWVSFLYLTEAYRGKGYGIQVLGRAIVLYRNLGRTALRLYAASSNTSALRFYKNCGFSVLSSESGSDGPLYLMEKKVGSGRILQSIR
ncbi:MAG: GNAT family N-acetyltransferase [Oscillospiraceae bacterium]|nr:GNAT family N-acetyltransferase [Oscillospiraceae bacterium]